MKRIAATTLLTVALILAGCQPEGPKEDDIHEEVKTEVVTLPHRVSL